MCDSPIPLTEASGGGGECNHCLPIKPERGSPWLWPLSGQDVGGVAVARSGITGPGRQEPDPGACLGHPSYRPFCSSGQQGCRQKGLCAGGAGRLSVGVAAAGKIAHKRSASGVFEILKSSD